jgi:hypothetical protein
VAPELVAEVPSARPPPPPPLALPFFLWAGWQKGFRHYFLAFHVRARERGERERKMRERRGEREGDVDK